MHTIKMSGSFLTPQVYHLIEKLQKNDNSWYKILRFKNATLDYPSSAFFKANRVNIDQAQKNFYFRLTKAQSCNLY